MGIKIPFTKTNFSEDTLNNSSVSLDSRLEGTHLTRTISELLSNSALFPILDSIRSIALEGIAGYLTEIAHYGLWTASIIQAWYLGRNPNMAWYNRFFGNLIGVTLYLTVDVIFEGFQILWQPYHWIYWGYSVMLGILSAWQSVAPKRMLIPTTLLNIVRVALLPAMYFIMSLEVNTVYNAIPVRALVSFFQTPSHQFILFGTLFFGLLLGLREAQVIDYTAFLQKAARKLKKYTEWSLDAGLVENAFSDEQVFNLQRVERSVLFMDIRGFTAWSEPMDPAQVVAVLNQYYNLSEKIVDRYKGHKPTFAADEVMTRFDDPARAVAAAYVLQSQLTHFLAPHQLTVGIGIHTGIAMEGLLGSTSTKQFDVIGDTVNTAKRLESAAGPGEILISAATQAVISNTIEVKPPRYLDLKGKTEPVAAYQVVI